MLSSKKCLLFTSRPTAFIFFNILMRAEHVLTLSCHLSPCCWVVAGLWWELLFPGFALFFIKCTCFCRPKMKSPDCSREGEVKHQNGTKKVGIWKINCVNFCSYYFLPQETVIPPTSPILNHEDVEENSHEMVIIQSDKSTGNFNFCRLFWFLADFLTFKPEEFLSPSWKLNHYKSSKNFFSQKQNYKW